MPKTLRKSTTKKRSSARKSASTRAKREKSSEIRTFRAAMTYLNTHTNYEKMVRVGYNHTNFNLSRMLRILAKIGNPHKQLKCVHLAGTKGKGSTAHMLSAMLTQAGYKTGLYTSPHLINIRERVRIDNGLISEAEFTRHVATIAPVVDKLKKDQPTYFEIMTAVALLHFVQHEVDIAVLETGLGGRLDATNVVKPEVCGITNISYDHMAQLGRTLEAITAEKAGIFKPGVPVISAPQAPAAEKVLRETAEKVGCDILFVGEGELEFSYRFESSRATGPHTRVCMWTPRSRYDHIQVPLLGEHQAMNCGVALGIADALGERGFKIGEQDAIDGLGNVRVEGRLELIHPLPRTVIDAAHNAESIGACMRAIGQNVTYDSMVVIFGCSADKDVEGMMKQLQLGADKVIFTTAGTPRSADPQELHQLFSEKSHKMAMVEPDLVRAFQTARRCVSRDDLICITGSIHLIGKAKALAAAGSFA